MIYGADTRIRTADLRFTKPLLCQLSYAGVGKAILRDPRTAAKRATLNLRPTQESC